MVGEEKRHQMMQNLFGDQSEEEEEEEEEEDEEVESEHESNKEPEYASDEGGVRAEPEPEVEGQGEMEVESEGELHDEGESDGQRGRSSQEGVSNQNFEREERESESDEREEYGQRVGRKRRDTVQSGSERSEQNGYAESLDEEVNQTASPRSPYQEEDATNYAETAPEIRDVFGDDSDEEPEYEDQNRDEEELNRSPVEEENTYEKLRPEDILADEEERYNSEEEHVGVKVKEKPVGPPLELEIPFCHPPAPADRLNMIKVSNIMGVDSKPFDPKTYVEEENFVTDDSGSKRRIRLENNIVRWRKVRNSDGSTSVESNARFVRWSDGSLQLFIGNEVLDISVQDAQHDQSHLFVRHGKGILQSQGKILKKMRFMPSSLTSNSHRMLTALVDSRHKKVYKVKNCVTDIDPEREKEQREKAASQNIKSTELLNKKKEKVKHKYNLPPTRKERTLSPGFLDDDEEGDYESRRPTSRRQFDDFEMEVRAEKRIMNAKKGHKDISRKASFPLGSSSRLLVDNDYGSDMEESEYETEGEEEEEEQTAPAGRRAHKEEEEEPEYADEEEEEEAEFEENVNEPSEEEDEEPRPKAKAHGSSLKRKEIESEEDSPPRKMAPHRRMAIVYDSDED